MSANAMAQDVTVLKHLDPWRPAIYPDAPGFTLFGSKVFFAGIDPINGSELWETDGTGENTHLVVDLAPGGDSSYPAGFLVLNKSLWFKAYIRGTPELMRSDGTAKGTTQLTSFGAPHGTDLGIRTNLAPLGPGVVFAAREWGPSSLLKLWISDGTPKGTARLSDLDVQQYGDLSSIGSVVLFAAAGSSNHQDVELYRTDGTPTGTVLVKDICPGICSSYPGDFAVIGNVAYFSASDPSAGRELWRTDGTAAGTYRVADIEPGAQSSNPSNLRAGSTRVFFSAATSQYGSEPWSSNGTAAGTTMIKDVHPGTLSGWAYEFETTTAGTVFFDADDGVTGRELWVSSAPYTSAQRVSDISPGAPSSYPGGLTWVGNHLYFSASTPGNGREAWVTDGFGAAPQLIADFNPSGDSRPEGFAGVGAGKVIFQTSIGDESAQIQVFDPVAQTVGTVASAIGTGDTTLPGIFSTGKQAFFFAYEPNFGFELWKTDGTSAGTGRIKDICPGPNSSVETWSRKVLLGEKLIFVANDGATGSEPWVSDGTAAGTMLLKDISPGAGSTQINAFGLSSGYVYFYRLTGVMQSELWRTDGTPAGTTLVSAIPAKLTQGDFFAHDGFLYFGAEMNSGHDALWRTDGTYSGTAMVLELPPQGASSGWALRGFRPAGKEFYFIAYGDQVWRSDGTAAGTSMVTNAPVVDFLPVQSGERLAYAGYDMATGYELRVLSSDGTDQVLSDIQVGPKDSDIADVTGMDGSAYLTAVDDAGRELWKTDGTAAGTSRVKDLWPGLLSGLPEPRYRTSNVTAWHGLLLFSGATPELGAELRRGDGTAEGTKLVADLRQGPGSSDPRDFAPLGAKRLVFTAASATGGRDLWVLTDQAGPELTCPEGMQVEAEDATGAEVDFPVPTPDDLLDPAPELSVDPQPGSQFPLGLTTVQAHATDKAGNQSSCSFAVEVVDTTPPKLDCPSTIALQATSSAGAPLAVESVVAKDTVDQNVMIEFTPKLGETLPPGDTSVRVVARDFSGNVAECEIRASVTALETPPEPKPAPRPAPKTAAGCNCDSTGASPMPVFALLAVMVAIAERRRALVRVRRNSRSRD